MSDAAAKVYGLESSCPQASGSSGKIWEAMLMYNPLQAKPDSISNSQALVGEDEECRGHAHSFQSQMTCSDKVVTSGMGRGWGLEP